MLAPQLAGYCIASVTPSDSNYVTRQNGGSATKPGYVTNGLLIGGAGNIAVVDEQGQAITIAVIAGQFLPIRVTQVKATGTSATGIVAFFTRD